MHNAPHGENIAMLPSLASPANPEVKRLVRLHRGAERRAQGAFLAEGRRVIQGFLDHGWVPRCLYLREDLDPPPGWSGVMRLISQRVLERVSQSRTPSGYLAEFPLPMARDSNTVDLSGGGLVLAGLTDPGNVGSLIRTAVALGFTQVAMIGGVDPYAGKVVQASAGALAAVRLFPLPAARDVETLASVAPVVALVVAGGDRLEDLAPGPRWVVVGSEAHGIPPAVLDRCTHRATLPMAPESESLNAAAAGAIALFLSSPLRRG